MPLLDAAVRRGLRHRLPDHRPAREERARAAADDTASSPCYARDDRGPPLIHPRILACPRQQSPTRGNDPAERAQHGDMAPSITPQGPTADGCDHYYETRMKGGEPIAVRMCALCHTPDWADLAAQASNVYQLGWEASTATGSDPLAFVPPTARHLPKGALDSATRGADMRDSRAYTAEGRNFLAHALLQLHRDGWLRGEAQPPATPIPEDAEPKPTPPAPEDPALLAVERPPTDGTDVLERRLKLAHQQRRAKEAQLDGIRRALLDTNVIQEGDPYSHADLEDVIRQANLAEAYEAVKRVLALPEQPMTGNANDPFSRDYLRGYRNATREAKQAIENPPAEAVLPPGAGYELRITDWSGKQEPR